MAIQEITPEYVLQPHAISRASYRLSATARKIIAMGMALIPPDLSDRVAKFTLSAFYKAIGIEKGGESYHLFEEALDECMGCVITINTPKEIKKFTWIQLARIDKKTGVVEFEFSVGLTEYLLDLKKMYSKIELQDIGKLKSAYAIRFFELSKSYESFSGQKGNRKGMWFFEVTVEKLRELFGVEEGKYSLTRDFRIFVIEKPCEEINHANLGMEITPEYIRRGKFLVGVRFSVKNIPKKITNRKLVVPASETAFIADNEIERLQNLYPKEYAALYAEEVSKPRPGFHTDGTWRKTAHFNTLTRLREKYGVRT